MYIIEIVRFSVKMNVTEEELHSLSFHFEKALRMNSTGFKKRILAKDTTSDMWVEMIWWDSMSSAKSALEVIVNTPEFYNYCSALVDDGGDDIKYYQIIHHDLI